MENKTLVRAKNFAVKNSGKLVVGATALLGSAGQAVAMTAGDIQNGSAVVSAGIAVAQTEPLGSVISAIAVGIGALIFIKIIRRLY